MVSHFSEVRMKEAEGPPCSKLPFGNCSVSFSRYSNNGLCLGKKSETLAAVALGAQLADTFCRFTTISRVLITTPVPSHQRQVTHGLFRLFAADEADSPCSWRKRDSVNKLLHALNELCVEPHASLAH